MQKRSWLRYGLFFLVAGTLFLGFCTTPGTRVNNDAGIPLTATDQFRVDLTEFAIPGTDQLSIDIANGNRYTWDNFAWQTFIAMNWPAVVPSAENGYLRGFPDSTKSFLDAGQNTTTPLVWETLKEKREMFKHGEQSLEAARPEPWSSDYLYGPKRLFGTGKFATLDETVQVQAEAREPFYKRDPVGIRDKLDGQPVVARVFRSENPSLTGAVGKGGVVMPGTQGPGNAVRYEVKVNYDFYKYVVDNELYYDKQAFVRSKKRPPAQLPWRTSLSDPGFQFLSQKSAEPSYVTGYSTTEARKAIYKARKANNGDVPPRAGAIHIKAAWAPIEEEEIPYYISRNAEYFSGRGDSKLPENAYFGLVGLHIIQRIKVIANQNVLNDDFAGISPLGGTFLFSTWEHKSIREQPSQGTYSNGAENLETTPYSYTNYFVKPVSTNPYPPLSTPFGLNRIYPILPHTKESNNDFLNLINSVNGGPSVWSNYRLVGTQFQAFNINQFGKKSDATVNSASNDGKGPFSPAGTGASNSQPFIPADTNRTTLKKIEDQLPLFLSNLVIETNVGLQQFQGQPPGLNIAPQFRKELISNNSQEFIRTGPRFSKSVRPQFGNMQRDTAVNMGGCMGCHGVAQLNGYSFSFVLLGGQAGADPDSELDFIAPLGSRNPGVVDSISVLRAYDGVTVQNTSTLGYLEENGPNPGTGSAKTDFSILPVDNRVKDSGFNYGDGVYITKSIGATERAYLTATDQAVPGNSGAFVLRFVPVANGTAPPPASVWYLRNGTQPLVTSDVLTFNLFAFESAAIHSAPRTGMNIRTFLGLLTDGTVAAIPELDSSPSTSRQLWNLKLSSQ